MSVTAIAPGAVASEVAREAGIHTSQLFRWRQELCRPTQAAAVFSPVVVGDEPGAALAPALLARSGAIDVEFATGARMRITGPVDAATGKAMIAALAKSERRR